PATPEENEEQNQGRRALWEAFEEDARREVSGFQTGQITGLSDRRPQHSIAYFKLLLVRKRGPPHRKGKSLAVVDHKTGRSFNDHDPSQLVLYAEHVGRIHNTRVTEGFFDEYRLVANLDTIRKPAFRRTKVRLNKKMLLPLIRRYKSAWKEILGLKKGAPPAEADDCWFCRSQRD
ncbi:MAG: hypothetical protein NTV93_21190, partial [Verrucomicrobia bacterium]|nr:hypothetical protein [Verrucomicrobiota bacterium]